MHISTRMLRRHRARLKLVEAALPAIRDVECCAVVWTRGARIRLLSPVLRRGEPSGRPWLDDAMAWLDAACFMRRCLPAQAA